MRLPGTSTATAARPTAGVAHRGRSATSKSARVRAGTLGQPGASAGDVMGVSSAGHGSENQSSAATRMLLWVQGSYSRVGARVSQVGTCPPDRPPSRSQRSRQASSLVTVVPRRRRGAELALRRGSDLLATWRSGRRRRRSRSPRLAWVCSRVTRVGSRVGAKQPAGRLRRRPAGWSRLCGDGRLVRALSVGVGLTRRAIEELDARRDDLQAPARRAIAGVPAGRFKAGGDGGEAALA
jgi:hypothetical protein